MEYPLYRLRDLGLDLAERRVLEIDELELPRRRITAIVGPNGAGKTTFLRALAFLLPPTSGRMEFDGHEVWGRVPEVSRLRQQVTLVAQSPLLFRRSVRANVAYGLRARRLAADGRVEAALEAVGLRGFSERPAWKLSGGESQRVAVARALAIDPPVYLFDEPTANVDREHAPIIESLLAELTARGKTVVFTSHNLEQAYRLSESVLSMVNGRVTPAPLVNVLRGTAVASTDGVYFHINHLRIEVPAGTNPRVIAIDPEHIIVSRTPLESSARNRFPGRITRVEHDDRGILLIIECGRPLVARITPHSYDELRLNIGATVWLTFKLSAIHVLEEAPPAEA